MSRQSNKIIALLDVLYLCTDTLIQTNAFARADLRASMDDAQAFISIAVRGWPGFMNRPWIMAKGKEFRVFAETVPAWEYEDATIVSMCERIITDVEEVSTTDLKRELISPLPPIYKKLHDFVDPGGVNFSAYGSSDKLLDELYQIVGW